MIDMLNKICNWTQSGSGGLHMILSEQQPVLGMIDLPSFTIMGKKVGVQTILGLAIAVCAGGCLMSSSIKGLMS
jgi:hypothetical protein